VFGKATVLGGNNLLNGGFGCLVLRDGDGADKLRGRGPSDFRSAVILTKRRHLLMEA
jgi:hypothetical protein